MSLNGLQWYQFLKTSGTVSCHMSYHVAYLTNLILLSILITMNKDEMNILAAESLLLFPYDEFPEG